VFGKFASMFIDTGDSDKQKTPSVEPAVVEPAPKPVVPVIPGQPDPEMVKILQDAIEAANLPGFDYIEFRDALVRMAQVPMTEELKFQAVYATAQSMVSKQGLLDAVDHYLKVIADKATEFQSYVQGVEATEVTAKQESVTKLTTDIEAKAAEISQLTLAIQEKRKQQDALNLEIVQAQQDIQNKKSSFEATRMLVANNLTADRTKIDTYLK
jgi:hypothetical protein